MIISRISALASDAIVWIYNLVRRLPFVHYDHIGLVANSCIKPLLEGKEDGISDQAYQWINYIKTFYTGYFDPGRNRWIEPSIIAEQQHTNCAVST